MKQLIALGGGGFSMEPKNPLLDDYLLKQADVSSPKICFLPTASGDSATYIERFYEAFRQKSCQPSYVNLLLLWKHWGIDTFLKEAYENGTILAGLSAGSICWFENGITDSYGEGLEPVKGLGFLPGSHAPHYDGERERRPMFQQLIRTKKIPGGIAADDGVGLHYRDGTLHTIVRSRPNVYAYAVRFIDGRLSEQQLEAIDLNEL
ncbi:LOW QUALITY PROTEIN: peptidase E [Bacillus sp. JCM 19047]|nr:LOW QUALITY PROTEIN: peptidase E [Bacillus sp. JCM 19047]